MTELQQDVERELALLPESEREAKRTKFAVFVVHNKLKPKLGEIPSDIPCVPRAPYPSVSKLQSHQYRYYAGEEIEDVW